MTDDIEIKVADLSVVDLKPGDVLMLRLPDQFDAESEEGRVVVNQMVDSIKSAVPGPHSVLILSGGVELAVIRPTSVEHIRLDGTP